MVSRKQTSIKNEPTTYQMQRAAHLAVLRARRAGILQRPDKCSKCAKLCKPSGHHADYSKPLDVVWLCGSCHRNIHIESPRPELISEIINGEYMNEGNRRKLWLTKRELQVVRLMAIGLRNQEIALEMKIGVRTVETHRERIYRFANVSNTAQLIGWGLKQGHVTTEMLIERFK